MAIKFQYLLKGSLNPDATEFLRVTRQHPQVDKYLFEDIKRITRVQQENWYNRYNKDMDSKIYLMLDMKTNLYVGYVTFTIKSLYHRRCEVGFVIHPDYQSKGFGKRMVTWAIKEAPKFEEHIHRLSLTVFPSNQRAIKLYKECGFESEGVLKSYIFKGGKYRNILSMAMLIKSD